MNFHELTPEERIKIVKKDTDSSFENITKTVLTEENSKGHIENFIGATQLPLGVVGPIDVNGKKRYIPLATTEGALVASTSRGAKAAKKIKVMITKNAMTRAPVFKAESAERAVEAAKWVSENFSEIKKEAEKESKHLKLLAINPYHVGRNVFFRMEYFTGEAMGMNMVTIGTQNAANYIQEKTKLNLVSLSGNLCIDKKPAGLTAVNGRGRSCIAETVISRKDVEEILKSTPEKIIDVNYRKNLIGSAKAASLGFNAHYANMAAAFFIATGQDPAQVVEASIGITTAEIQGDDLYFSISMPAVELGIMGGGTKLPTQAEAIKITKATTSDELAEVLCAAVLCGELSLLAALTSNTLASSHKNLGR